MDTLMEVARETWSVTQQMAPYLLFGFLMGGILSVLVSAKTVERHLGERNIWQVIKASLLGIPLPLCSCSVVPVSASLYRHGASRGATLSFLASTPQTGADSIAITWSLLGPVFTIFRILAAFLSGVLSGVGAEWGHREKDQVVEEEKKSCGCCSGKKQEGWFLRMMRYGFVTLPADIGRAMFFGLLLSGVLTALLPDNFFADTLGTGLVAMLAMMVVGIPLYTCSVASVPVALGMMNAGLAPGAALVFLVTGPATNAATVTTLVQLLGRRSVIIYLACIAATALTLGWGLDWVVAGQVFGEVKHAMHHEEMGLLSTLSAILLLIVLLPSFRSWLPKRKGVSA
jgi:uncharacterized membrane protein YraQ (UPF0718 family)